MSVSTDRGWRIKEACRAVARRRAMTGQALEKVAGHQSFAGLLCRLSLSILFTTYKFCRAEYLKNNVIWKSVREEQRAFAALVMFIEANLELPWGTHVYCSDASLSGGAFACRHVDAVTVGRVGRTLERDRFRRHSSAVKARRHAIKGLGLLDVVDVGDESDEDDLELITDPRTIRGKRNQHADFEEVPSSVLDPSRWSMISSFRWNVREDILILEARSVLYAVRDAVQRVVAPSRIVFLVDNLGLAFALEKGRSSQNFVLNSIIRKTFVLQVISGHRFYFRWIPSEVNYSDFGSRLFETNKNQENLALKALDTQAHMNSDSVAIEAQGLSTTPSSISSCRTHVAMKWARVCYSLLHVVCSCEAAASGSASICSGAENKSQCDVRISSDIRN